MGLVTNVSRRARAPVPAPAARREGGREALLSRTGRRLMQAAAPEVRGDSYNYRQ